MPHTVFTARQHTALQLGIKVECPGAPAPVFVDLPAEINTTPPQNFTRHAFFRNSYALVLDLIPELNKVDKMHLDLTL